MAGAALLEIFRSAPHFVPGPRFRCDGRSLRRGVDIYGAGRTFAIAQDQFGRPRGNDGAGGSRRRIRAAEDGEAGEGAVLLRGLARARNTRRARARTSARAGAARVDADV